MIVSSWYQSHGVLLAAKGVAGVVRNSLHLAYRFPFRFMCLYKEFVQLVRSRGRVVAQRIGFHDPPRFLPCMHSPGTGHYPRCLDASLRP